jgi:hypothetical protein
MVGTASAAMLLIASALAPAAQAGIPAIASVTVTLVTDPASDPQDFVFSNIFQVSELTTNTLDTDASSAGTLNSYGFAVSAVDIGYLYVSVAKPSDWTLTDILCTGDSQVSYNVNGNNVSLQPDSNETIACTFYMTKFAQVGIRKVTVPANDPQDFHFDITGTGAASDWDLDTDPGSMFTGSNISWPLQPDDLGEYTFTEAEVPGWTLTSIVCTGNTDSDRLTSLEDRVVEIGVDAGELIECTFTNVKDGFESTPPSDAPTDEPTDAPTIEPTSPPTAQPTDAGTVPPSQDASVPPATFEPSQDQGDTTDQPTEAGTDTEGQSSSVAGGSNVILLVLALGVLSAVLLVTRPKKKRP